MQVLLREGVLGTEGPLERTGFSKTEDLASQRAYMAGEWNIPGHRLMGLRLEEPASMETEVVVFVVVVVVVGYAVEESVEK